MHAGFLFLNPCDLDISITKLINLWLLPKACSCSGVAQGSSVWGSSCPWCGIWKWLPHCLHGTHGSSKEQFYTWSSKQTTLHFTFIIPKPSHELPGYHPFSVNVNHLVTNYTYTLTVYVTYALTHLVQHSIIRLVTNIIPAPCVVKV